MTNKNIMETKIFNWKPVEEYTGGRVLATNDIDILVGYINSDGDCESEDSEGTFLCGITGFVNIEDILPKSKESEDDKESEDEKIRKAMTNWLISISEEKKNTDIQEMPILKKKK